MAKINLKAAANRINKALDAAAALAEKADDKRLLAAIEIAKAKEACKTAKRDFKTWCENNLSYSWETVRKLAPVGAAELKEEGAGAAKLATMREKNRAANAKARAQKTEDAPKGKGSAFESCWNLFVSLTAEERAKFMERAARQG